MKKKKNKQNKTNAPMSNQIPSVFSRTSIERIDQNVCYEIGFYLSRPAPISTAIISKHRL